jgi:hypothetical protein
MEAASRKADEARRKTAKHKLAAHTAIRKDWAENIDGATTAIMMCVARVATFWHSLDPISNAFESKVVVYPIHCANPDISLKLCAKGQVRLDPRVTYTVHVAEQFVKARTDGVLEPDRLTNCAIADRKNWSCPEPANQCTHLVMHDGQFTYEPPFPDGGNAGFTSRLRYFYTKYVE